jgi:hypothetical protein
VYHRFFILILWLVLLVPSAVEAFDPLLHLVLPRGGTRGQELEINLHGARLYEPQELLFYHQGITVKSLTMVNGKHVKAKLIVAPDARLGEYPVRLRCKGGITYMRTFWIGQFPVVKEAEPNNDFTKPQVVPMNSTVHGTAGLEDVDYYRVSAKKGQKISVEIEGMRLGAVFFDPYLAILDAKRFEVATSDDTPLLRQDAFVSIMAPDDGDYTILVRESAYEGSDKCRYRVHIGGFSRPTAVYPPAAVPGQIAELMMIGDPAGDYPINQQMDASEGDTYPLYVTKDGLTTPSPNPVFVSSLPFANEEEPNNSAKQAVPKQALAAPCAFHGIISKTGDADWFRFKAKKGQNLRIRVRARSLRSPLDSVLALRDAKGKHIQYNDDQGGVDSIIDFKPPADGEYMVMVRDHLKKGGPSYTYRLEIDFRHPELSASLPVVKRNDSQLRKVICVPQGNRYATVVNISRKNVACDCQFKAESLPRGVSLRSSKAPRAANNFLALFEASAEAPVAGGLHRFTIHDAKADSQIHGPLKETVNHIEINNTGVFHSTSSDRVAIAVIEKAPFHVDLQVPAVPMVRNGTAELQVKVRRGDGFDGAVKVTLPWKPPGIGSPTEITIAKDKTEGVFAINASGDAALGKYELCVSGEIKTKQGTVMVSSSLVPLEVTEPLLTVNLEMASTIPGKNTPMLCKITHNQPIQGKAQVILHGLPHGVKAEPQQIDSNTKEVVFDLQVADDAAKGNHNAVFCQVLPKQNGHVIAHNTGHGGSLRINPPPPSKKAAKAGKPKTPDSNKDKKTPKKPLSRLEQLRQRNP